MIDSHQSEYLRNLLDMNPVDHAREILSARKQFLDREHPDASHAGQTGSSTERRAQILQQIEGLRKALWTMEKQELQAQLTAIDVSEFPDLGVSVSRLQRIIVLRKAFQRLEQHPACFPEFYEKFCRLVVAPPREAGLLRSQFLEEIRNEAQQPGSPGLRAYRRVVKVINLEYHELKSLERLWLNQLTMRPRPKKISSKTLEILFQIMVFSLALITLIIGILLSVPL